ncbi:hypothetical protein [Halobacteriovorax sp. RT-2-6]|uniref:hypothetical protein n=1 Tax=unclassified Halobacteriovorax TaxID=2639665 RepID=UPI0039994F7F
MKKLMIALSLLTAASSFANCKQISKYVKIYECRDVIAKHVLKKGKCWYNDNMYIESYNAFAGVAFVEEVYLKDENHNLLTERRTVLSTTSGTSAGVQAMDSYWDCRKAMNNLETYTLVEVKDLYGIEQ